MAAVYPVTGDFAAGNLATTDSYSGQFIPQLWSGKLLAKFYQNTAGGFWMQKSDTLRMKSHAKIRGFFAVFFITQNRMANMR